MRSNLVERKPCQIKFYVMPRLGQVLVGYNKCPLTSTHAQNHFIAKNGGPV